MQKPTGKNALTQDRLKELLCYDPATGVFTWLERKAPVGATKTQARCMQAWNARFAGCVAGCKEGTRKPYIGIRVMTVRYRAHRLAFLYMIGRVPTHGTDHRNHVRSDNAWDNLREATHSVNSKNMSRYETNTSGVTGVHRLKKRGKWLVNISVGDKTRFIGHFQNFDDAVAARKAAEIQYGFHKNHGKKTTEAASAAYR